MEDPIVLPCAWDGCSKNAEVVLLSPSALLFSCGDHVVDWARMMSSVATIMTIMLFEPWAAANVSSPRHDEAPQVGRARP